MRFLRRRIEKEPRLLAERFPHLRSTVRQRSQTLPLYILHADEERHHRYNARGGNLGSAETISELDVINPCRWYHERGEDDKDITAADATAAIQFCAKLRQCGTLLHSALEIMKDDGNFVSYNSSWLYCISLFGTKGEVQGVVVAH